MIFDKKLLILDDDVNLSKALSEDFTDKGYDVFLASSISEVENQLFDFAILDLRLVNESGLKAISTIKSMNINCKIIILTGYGSVATAVQAIKLGAVNYLRKPASSDLIESAFLNADLIKNDMNLKFAPLEQNEHEYIEFVLNQNNGNITKTAKYLGLHRQSLQRKLKKYPNLKGEN